MKDRILIRTFVLAVTLSFITQLVFAQETARVGAQREVPAILAGHALFPVRSTVATPQDAPSDLFFSGKYTTGVRVTELGSVEGRSGGRPTGIGLPIIEQPRQGHSGIKYMADGTYWVLSDNGFGNKANSPDAMLFLSQYTIDWNSGAVRPLRVVFLHDPDHKVPFHIVNESSEKRYLTGSDFDPESFQFTHDAIWIGDEFGPYLIKTDFNGRVQAVFETLVDGKVVKSPDNPTLTMPGNPDGNLNFQVVRSKGFEGMALSKDGTKLYPLLEGALWTGTEYENIDGRRYLRILEFDLAKEEWSGRYWQYVLENNELAIGDFNMIDDTHALVIERDNGEGTEDRALPPGGSPERFFTSVAQFKRVYRIMFSEENAGGPVEKQAYIDLMNISDPDKRSRVPLNNGRFTFPFFTIECVDVVFNNHIVVGNDNNFPGSSSREPNRADDNEFILLRVDSLFDY